MFPRFLLCPFLRWKVIPYKCVSPGKPELNKSKSGDLNSIPFKVYTNWLSNYLSTFRISTWTAKAGIISKTISAYLVQK